MNKIFVFLGILIIIVGLLYFGLSVVNRNKQTVPEATQRDKLVSKAKQIFQEKINEGISFENGPCLSEELAPDWVLDVAHNPRQDIDNLAQNQCQAFKSGKAHHFIELDTEGNVVKVF